MYLFFNGTYQPVAQPLFTAANRAYRYGEGLFETMLYHNGQVRFLNEHLQRLQQGMQLLGIQPPPGFNADLIACTAAELVHRNNHEAGARIRLSVTAGNGLLYDVDAAGFEWLLETFPHPVPAAGTTGKPIELGLFTAAQKNKDALSGVKTASHLVYALAARHAKTQGWNDAVVLNTDGHVCDTSIANIFLVKEGLLITPPLTSGCIAGIMRQKLLEWCTLHQVPFLERPVLPGELLLADELFTTNVIRGIGPVARYGGKTYGNKWTNELATRFTHES